LPPHQCKAFFVAPHGFMDWEAAHSYAADDVHGAMGCNQKSFTIV
jgi:hypothetical protein